MTESGSQFERPMRAGVVLILIRTGFFQSWQTDDASFPRTVASDSIPFVISFLLTMLHLNWLSPLMSILSLCLVFNHRHWWFHLFNSEWEEIPCLIDCRWSRTFPSCMTCLPTFLMEERRVVCVPVTTSDGDSVSSCVSDSILFLSTPAPLPSGLLSSWIINAHKSLFPWERQRQRMQQILFVSFGSRGESGDRDWEMYRSCDPQKYVTVIQTKQLISSFHFYMPDYYNIICPQPWWCNDKDVCLVTCNPLSCLFYHNRLCISIIMKEQQPWINKDDATNQITLLSFSYLFFHANPAKTSEDPKWFRQMLLGLCRVCRESVPEGWVQLWKLLSWMASKWGLDRWVSSSFFLVPVILCLFLVTCVHVCMSICMHWSDRKDVLHPLLPCQFSSRRHTETAWSNTRQANRVVRRKSPVPVPYVTQTQDRHNILLPYFIPHAGS